MSWLSKITGLALLASTFLGMTAQAQEQPDIELPLAYIGRPIFPEMGIKSDYNFRLEVEAPGLFEFAARRYAPDAVWAVDGHQLVDAHVHLDRGSYRISFVGAPIQSGLSPSLTVYRSDPVDDAEPNDLPEQASAVEDAFRAVLSPRGDEDWFTWEAPAAGQLLFFIETRDLAPEVPMKIAVQGPDGLVEMAAPANAAQDTFGPWPVEAAEIVRFVVSSDGSADYLPLDIQVFFAEDGAGDDSRALIQVIGIELDVATQNRFAALVGATGGRFLNVADTTDLAAELDAIAQTIEDDIAATGGRSSSPVFAIATGALAIIILAVIYRRRRKKTV